jgi:penicillin-binding protein-related factor A (putative recombinase)
MGLSLNTHSRRGSELETLIEVSTASGLVCLSKMNADARWFKGKGMTATAGPVDYVGEVAATGRAICFDAKQSDEAAAFPLAKLKRHQLAYLVKHGRAGAISGILVGATHDRVGAYLWLDWKDIPAALSGGVKWESEAWVEAGRWGGMVEWGKIVGSKQEKQ